MNDDELIQQSLDCAAERTDDLTPQVYSRFFAAYPEAQQYFEGDIGRFERGRMLAQILQEITNHAQGKVYPHNIMRWGQDHLAYSATLPMFIGMFACVVDSVRELVGDAWTAEMLAAWQRQIDGLLMHIRRGIEEMGEPCSPTCRF